MKFIIHIGTEKTGTTSLQQFLFKHRKILSEQGVLYPSDLCGENHICLPAVGLSSNDKSEITNSAYQFIGKRGYTDMPLYVYDTLEKQIKEHKPSIVIISNEHLHSRVDNIDGIRRIYKLLSNFSRSIEIVAYVRRQDRLAISAYSTRFKFGYAYDGDLLPPVFPTIYNKKPYYYDYRRIADNWSTVFGEDRFFLKVFEKEINKDGGLLKSFINSSAPFVKINNKIERKNESISMDATLFLSKFNSFLNSNGIDYSSGQKIRNTLIDILEKHYQSKIKPSSRDLAEKFYKNFIDDNNVILGKYGESFDDNFEEYQPNYEYIPNASVFAEIAARLVMLNTQ